jgi:hypothetical protein
MMSRAFFLPAVLIATGAALTFPLEAQSQSTGKPPDLTGIYEAVPLGMTILGEFKGSGTLADIELKPAAVAEAKARNLEDDPAKNCQVVGPFRMMARDDNKIEVVTSPDRIYVMFENNALGNMRQIFLQRKHLEKMEPSWMGDSVGSWEGDTLVVDAAGFNDRTWLNDAGAPHGKGLHLIERYRLVGGGGFLEYKVTAEHPDVLLKPYTYTRYYKRTNVEFREDFCGR